MRRAITSWTVASTLSLGLGLGAASCATAIGLDQVTRVDCVEDCGADAGIDDGEGGPASDVTLRDAPAIDSAMADRQIEKASPRTCTPGLACDGGRCDDAGVCRPGCTSNAGCAAPKPVCDTATNTCVQGCNTVADCTASDAGGPPANACCNHLCSNTTTDDQNCGGCGLVLSSVGLGFVLPGSWITSFGYRLRWTLRELYGFSAWRPPLSFFFP